LEEQRHLQEGVGIRNRILPVSNRSTGLEIAIIRRDCGKGRGGAERYCHGLCTGLKNLGHRVFLLAETCDEDLKGSIDFVPLKVRNINSVTRNLSFHWAAQKALLRFPNAVSYAISRTWPVDAFRITDPLHAHTIAIRYRSFLKRLWATLSPRHRVLLGLEKSVISPEGSRYVVTISELDKNLVQKYYSVSPERIRVIYNGVDQDVFSPEVRQRRSIVRENLGLGEDVTCYIFPAMDFRRKGLEVLLNALSRLNFPWELLVAGQDRDASFRKQASRLGIASRVHFLGRRKDIQDLYGASDLMVLPTTYDPFGNVHLEALACGLPVLTTAQAGGAEVVRPGQTGYVIKNGNNVNELEAALRDFESRKDQWPEWREQACISIKPFSPQRNAMQTAELLSELAKESAQRHE
jgi:UDP-glucose:(heptosyl)LPS alpha-1,3-glucosyltransferase